MLPRLALAKSELGIAVEILTGYLEDKSRIVKTFCMQALADLAKNDEALRRKVIPLIKRLSQAGSPAMKSRGKKLLKELMKT